MSSRMVYSIAFSGAVLSAVFAVLVACKVQPFIVPKEQFTLAVALLAGATLALAVIGCMCYSYASTKSVEATMDSQVETLMDHISSIDVRDRVAKLERVSWT